MVASNSQLLQFPAVGCVERTLLGRGFRQVLKYSAHAQKRINLYEKESVLEFESNNAQNSREGAKNVVLAIVWGG